MDQFLQHLVIGQGNFSPLQLDTVPVFQFFQYAACNHPRRTQLVGDFTVRQSNRVIGAALELFRQQLRKPNIQWFNNPAMGTAA